MVELRAGGRGYIGIQEGSWRRGRLDHSSGANSLHKDQRQSCPRAPVDLGTFHQVHLLVVLPPLNTVTLRPMNFVGWDGAIRIQEQHPPNYIVIICQPVKWSAFFCMTLVIVFSHGYNFETNNLTFVTVVSPKLPLRYFFLSSSFPFFFFVYGWGFAIKLRPSELRLPAQSLCSAGQP